MYLDSSPARRGPSEWREAGGEMEPHTNCQVRGTRASFQGWIDAIITVVATSRHDNHDKNNSGF